MTAYYSINSNVVGLIVRGKKGDAHNPRAMEQHADCILPGGEPVGFFGENGDASSGSCGLGPVRSLPSLQRGPSISLNSTGLNMGGMVARHSELERIRPYYVNVELAKRYGVVSTVLLISVDLAQASLFNAFWDTLKLNPGAFNILGGNCSTKAAKAFSHAKIINGGIPGLDTPNNLYKYLKTKYQNSQRIFSGHIGAKSVGENRYDLVVD